MKSKELRAKRFKIIEDARALIAGDSPTAEQNAQFDAMMAEADGLKAQIDRIERAEELAAEQNEALRAAAERNGHSLDEQSAIVEDENKAFMSWVRRGLSGLNAKEREIYEKRFQAAQSEGSNSAGGYTVPQGFYQKLEDAQKAYGGMIDASFVFDTASGNALPIPTDNDTSNSGAILAENTQVSAQDITFGVVTLNAYTYTSKLVLVSNQLLQDSAFDLNAFLSKKLGERIARATNTHFTTGSGSSQPNGVVTAATLGITAAGTGGSVAAIGFDDLVDLEHSVDPAYRKAAQYMMSDAALKAIKKIKDSQNRPLWLAGLAVKEPDTINGMPYVINQDVAAPAASAKSVLFGDFSRYYIRRVAGVQVLRLTERYADYNQTGFLAFQRWDGNLVDAGTHPIKYLQHQAS